MIYSVTVKVEGETFVKQPYSLAVGVYNISVKCNEKKTVNELNIQRKVHNYDEFIPLMIPGNHIHTLNIPYNPYHQEIIALLQHLESLGSFWFCLKKIYWDDPNVEWIPENEEEKGKVKINNVKFHEEYDNTPIEMSPLLLKEIIDLQDLYKHLVLPLAFYREGRNEFRSQRYVNAYFNFFFYLEDLYGRGKTNNTQLEQAFKQSIQFLKWTLLSRQIF
jgi:hypothetical protein